jgi:hypothetical protein
MGNQVRSAERGNRTRIQKCVKTDLLGLGVAGLLVAGLLLAGEANAEDAEGVTISCLN